MSGASAPGPESGPGPVLVYDGDCGFCTRAAAAARRLPTSARIVAAGRTDLAALGLTRERAAREVVWVAARRGRIDGGAQAVASLLLDCGGGYALLGCVLRLPPGRWLAAGAYRLVAANRHRLPGGTPGCAVPHGSG